MVKISGGQMVARVLKDEGVEYLFCLPGAHTMSIFQGCVEQGIKLIDTRHEQAAVHMADAWARLTGKPGVVAVTAGPGVTNTVTGLWVANENLSPIIVIGGKSPLSTFDMGTFLEFDQLSLVKPVTKWSKACYETARIPEYMSMAFREATSGRPGPAYLEFPIDVLGAEVDEAEVTYPEKYRTQARQRGDDALIAEAVDLLLQAEKPVVIGGSGIWWSRAEKELQEFIEYLRLPLVLGWMSRGAVPEDHPFCFGTFLNNTEMTRQADVVITIGARQTMGLGFGRPPTFNEKAK